MWLDIRGKKAVWVRNSYKTSVTYGTKKHTITDTQFLTALKNIFSCQKRDESCGVIIGNTDEDKLGYWVSKATYNNLGEGNYFKVAVNANKNNLQKLKEISSSRCTNLDTIINNYDINNIQLNIPIGIVKIEVILIVTIRRAKSIRKNIILFVDFGLKLKNKL